jgi:hypothetical protein
MESHIQPDAGGSVQRRRPGSNAPGPKKTAPARIFSLLFAAERVKPYDT